jgi:hypothetical protein
MKAAGPIFVVSLLFAGSTGFAGCSNSGESVDGGTQTGGDGASREPILDGGGIVPPPPDGAAQCPASTTCNYQTGQGCPATQTCEPSNTDGKPTCTPAGSKQSGETCTPGGTECAPGMVCAGGACRKICCGVSGMLKDWSACPPNEHCLLDFKVQLATQVVDTGAFLCYPVNNCSALDPGSCASIAPGTTCQIADATGATACLSEGSGGAGAACPCKGGFACVSSNMINSCRRLCKAVVGGGDPACPPSEGRCVHFNRDPDGVGECTLI